MMELRITMTPMMMAMDTNDGHYYDDYDDHNDDGDRDDGCDGNYDVRQDNDYDDGDGHG